MKSWSFSRYETHAKCPLRAKLQYDDRVPLPANPHGDRGTKLHDNAQTWVKGESEDLDPALSSFQEELAALRPLYVAGKVRIEDEWGWAERFASKATWKEAWVRMKLDFYVSLSEEAALVVDLKSGKKSGNEIKHTEQGELYAIGAYLDSDCTLKEIFVEFWYADQNDTMKTRYTEERILALLPRWVDRGLKVTSGHYPARANIYSCKFCPFRLVEDGGNGVCAHAVQIIKVTRKKPNSGLFDFGIR
jgi:hypothetical protein